MSTLAPAAVPTVAFVGRDQLILQSEPLVRRAIGHYMIKHTGIMDPEDIYSCGTMGLIDAVDRYDQNRGVKFETYAVTRIRGYLVDQMRAMDWLPRSARTNVRLVQKATTQIEESLGRKPEAGELATQTGLPDSACTQALVDGSCRVLSLEAITPDSDDASTPMVRHLVDENAPSPAAALERQELRQELAHALRALPPRECDVLRLKYLNGWACRQIAAHLGVSESRVSQLNNQGLARMRRSLIGRFGEAIAEKLIA